MPEGELSEAVDRRVAGDEAMARAAGLSGEAPAYDAVLLERLLANEPDMSFKRRARAVFDFLALEPTDRVLDAGCGRGFYLNFLRHLYPRVEVTGVELDLPLLPLAKAHVPGARVLSANLYGLPFADGAFTKIICSEVMEHIPDDARAMRELARVLAPGGHLALSVPNANYPLLWDPINKVLEGTLGTHIQTGPLAGIWANHVRLYTPEALADVVAAAGLEVVETRCYTHFAFPFIHNLVYGIGKPLLERGLLPPSMATAADRYAADQPGSLLNPVRLGLAAFNAVDRLNDRFPPTADQSFLNIALHAYKPSASGAGGEAARR